MLLKAGKLASKSLDPDLNRILEIVVSSQPRIACRRSSARRPFETMTRTVTESQGLHDDDECTSMKKIEVKHDGRSSIFPGPVRTGNACRTTHVATAETLSARPAHRGRRPHRR